jgi:hypothetical protein
MPHRQLLDTSKFDFVKLSGLDVGDVVTVTIAEAPKEYFHKVYISTVDCPICGESTEKDSDRVGIGIYPKFTRLSGLGFGGWAHRECLKATLIIDEPTPTPW